MERVAAFDKGKRGGGVVLDQIFGCALMLY